MGSVNLETRFEDKFVHIFESEEEVYLVLHKNEVKNRNTRSSISGHEVHKFNVNNYTEEVYFE